MPATEKREKTTFNEFKLSNPDSAFRRKTLVEYKQELENMRKASFKARSFDKAKFERRNKSANSDTSSKKDMRQHRIMTVPFNLKTDSRGQEKQKNTKVS